MIVFGKLTGKTLGNKAEVELVTLEHYWLPMLAHGVNSPLPSDKWIEENKDNFLAVVFIGGGRNVDCVLGFHPVKGAVSAEYNVQERLIQAVKDLTETLKNATVNTSLGPQKFLPDTIMKFTELNTELESISSLIRNIE